MMRETNNRIAAMERTVQEMNERMTGIYWKMGLLAGIVAIISSEIFGGGIGSAINALIGVWPL